MAALTVSIRCIFTAIVFLFLSHRCQSWMERREIQDRLLDMGHSLVIDLARKGEAAWLYRKVYFPYASFAMGERVFIIRARFAAMIRQYLRSYMKRKTYTVDQLLRQALMLQRRTQGIYILNTDMLTFDIQFQTEGNPLNWTRFDKHNCHVAGPPCDIITTRRSAMDEALRLIDRRRQYIRQKYQPNKNKPTIDIEGDFNRSLKFKYTTSPDSQHQDTNTDFVNIAPDL